VKKLVLGVTVPGSSRLLDGQVKYFKSKGYDVYLLSPDHPKEHKFCAREGCVHLPVSIEKEIALLADIKTIFQIVRHLKRVKPDIVNVGTPKMGLLGIISSFLLRIPNRIYTCRGLRYESEKGLKRMVLRAVEKFTVMLANKVIYVGHSLRESAIANKTADTRKSFVIAKGSSNGVKLDYFSRTTINEGLRSELLKKHGLDSKFIIGYVGRICLHKGSIELIAAFDELYSVNSRIRLVLIGHMDCPEEFRKRVKSHPGIVYFEFLDDVPLYMSLFDIFVLPSWREGFSNASIQAAAMGLPVITSTATGCRDAISPGFNGQIFPTKSVARLREAINLYVGNQDMIDAQSQNSILWAQNFKSEIIWDGIEKVYNEPFAKST
jgi:glycosyltransferase involved in cell wall biosynthesis